MTAAFVKGNRILEIIIRRPGEKIERGQPGDDSRIVDITAQPWLKVGDYWGPDPTQWVNPPDA